MELMDILRVGVHLNQPTPPHRHSASLGWGWWWLRAWVGGWDEGGRLGVWAPARGPRAEVLTGSPRSRPPALQHLCNGLAGRGREAGGVRGGVGGGHTTLG